MPAMLTPETARLADELASQLGDAPITPREFAAAIAAADRSSPLVGALEEALARAGDGKELDPRLWGPPPSAADLAAAEERTRAAVEDALAAALAHSVSRWQAARRLGISPQAVSKRLAAGKLVALQRGREKRLPVWQFHDDGVLPGVDGVITAWPGTALALTHWATSPSPDLGDRTPAQLLARRDGVRRVLEAVRALTPDAW